MLVFSALLRRVLYWLVLVDPLHWGQSINASDLSIPKNHKYIFFPFASISSFILFEIMTVLYVNKRTIRSKICLLFLFVVKHHHEYTSSICLYFCYCYCLVDHLMGWLTWLVCTAVALLYIMSNEQMFIMNDLILFFVFLHFYSSSAFSSTSCCICCYVMLCYCTIPEWRFVCMHIPHHQRSDQTG